MGLNKTLNNTASQVEVGSSSIVGIRMIEAWRGAITLDKKVKTLLSVSHLAFLNQLMRPDDSNVPVGAHEVSLYLQNRRLFPAYFQGEIAVTLFILLQVIVYKNKAEGMDFYVPSQFVNQKVLMELLARIDIGLEECAFIDGKNSAGNHEPKATKKVRVFFGFDLSDSDYKALYYVSNSAGAAGDDSITTVLSAESLPLFLHATHMVKASFSNQLKSCARDVGCLKLANYLYLIDGEIKLKINERVYAATASSRSNFDKDEKLYDVDLPYLVFQKELVYQLACHVGSFVEINFTALHEDLARFRSFLYENGNVFTRLPEILAGILPNIKHSKQIDLVDKAQSGLFFDFGSLLDATPMAAMDPSLKEEADPNGTKIRDNFF